MRRLGRTENLGQPRQAGADVLHRIVAPGLGETLGRPGIGQARGRGRIERRRQLAGAELRGAPPAPTPIVLRK
jgi:hypothetical protein